MKYLPLDLIGLVCVSLVMLKTSSYSNLECLLQDCKTLQLGAGHAISSYVINTVRHHRIFLVQNNSYSRLFIKLDITYFLITFNLQEIVAT